MVWNDNIRRAVRHAELKSASSEFVYATLEEYGQYLRLNPYMARDDDLESLLASRQDKLINLGLAQFGGCKAVIATLYKDAMNGSGDAEYDRGIRIASLGNHAVGDYPFGEFWDTQPNELRRLATEGDSDEVNTLLQNEGAGRILRLVLDAKEPFDELSSERLAVLVKNCAGNRRLRMDETDSNGPDLLAMSLQDAVFNCVRRAPLDAKWLAALYSLLQGVEPSKTCSTSEILFREVLDKWKGYKVFHYLDKNKEVEGWNTELSLVDEFRCMFAALYGRAPLGENQFKMRALGSPSDDDIGYRAAYFGNAELDPQEIRSGRAKDGNAFTLAAVLNDRLFQNNERRAALEESLSGRWINVYFARCSQLKAQFPNFDKRPQTEWLASTFDEERPPSASDHFDANKSAGELEKITEQLRSLHSWIVWGFICLGTMMLIRHI